MCLLVTGIFFVHSVSLANLGALLLTGQLVSDKLIGSDVASNKFPCPAWDFVPISQPSNFQYIARLTVTSHCRTAQVYFRHLYSVSTWASQ